MTVKVGTTVRVVASFTDLDGVATDPDSIAVTIRTPSTVIQQAMGDLVRESVGVYYLEQSIDSAGKWWFHFDGDGAADVADETLVVGVAAEATE